MTTPILAITDGDIVVNLIGPNSGFFVKEWKPQTPDLKGGGSWQESPLSDGRKPVIARLTNVFENFTIGVNGFSPNSVARDTRKLRRLLKKARDYWSTNYQNQPVWIEARAMRETTIRYALLMNGRAPEDADPFNSPFISMDCIVVMDDFPYVIERESLWRYERPVTTTAIELSAVQDFNSLNMGNVDSSNVREPTTAAEVFFTNKHPRANLSHVFLDDGGVFSGNLIGAAPPYNILPAVPVVNDAIYFGCQTSILNSGPFNSLVFDIGTAATNVTITWEYWSGAAWTAFAENPTDPAELQDNTSDFTLSGVRSVHWFPQSNWATTAMNGITGYWVRARVSAVAGPTGATQQNRNIYSIAWPYVEVQSTEIKGDHPALCRLKIYNKSCGLIAADGEGEPQAFADRIVFGMRQVDRGSLFTSYLNIADEQNPTGVTVTAPNATFATDVEGAPSGRRGDWQPVGVSAMNDRWLIELNDGIAWQYYGRFHAYVRFRAPGAAEGDFKVQLRVLANSSTSNLYQQSRELTIPIQSNLVEIPVDFGKFTIPPGGLRPDETLDNLYFAIRAECTDAAGGELRAYDLILIPADEWIGSISESASLNWTHMLYADNYLDADSCTFPKRMIYAPVRDLASGDVQLTYRPIAAAPIQIATEERMRIWFLAMATRSFPEGAGDKAADPVMGFAAQLEVIQRYESAIGDDI